MKINEFFEMLDSGNFDERLKAVYGNDEKTLERQKNRYKEAVSKFSKTYPHHTEIEIFSAPGRTEIGGNHTDHQHGCVLAAAVDVDIIGVVAFHDGGVIRILSEGYDEISVKTSETDICKGDGGSVAITRGILSKFKEEGIDIAGFDMYAVSDVLSGSGISSSAAFETLIGTVMDKHYNDGRLGAVEIAKIGQFAENVYFGKKSGLMDQMVSSVGGFVFIDFENPQKPVVKSCEFDFEKSGYCLFITDTKGSHADLTDDYVAITEEMREVAACFGKDVMRQVDRTEFFEKLPDLREKCSDRAILRAIHFLGDNERAWLEFSALEHGDVSKFLALVNESGESSKGLLQNLYSSKKPKNQEIPLALEISRRIVGEKGAVRVHGGGFAGTIQAFVPVELAKEYQKQMDNLFGEGSSRLMKIRPYGGIVVIK